jgi:hypothetical protein
MFQIGYLQTMKEVCDTNNASLYDYIPFKHTELYLQGSNTHYCLREIPQPKCFVSPREMGKCKQITTINFMEEKWD